MKKSPRTPTPRRPLWRRGAFFGACLTACALSGALIWGISGGALSRFSLFNDSEVAPTPNLASNPKNGARAGSLTTALAKIDAQTVRAYVERWTQAPRSAAPEARQVIRIDAAALARRHPAWRLATALENGAVMPSDPQIARVLATESAQSGALIPLSSPRTAAPRAASGAIFGESRAVQTQISAQRTEQNRALDRFLAQSASLDAARARDEALLALRALDETVARAALGTVSESDVPLLAPDVALELLNLRLQLLNNLARTPAQRAAAREQIRAIVARYNALLQLEADAQAARVRAATLEIPAQIRREGLLQIERARQNAARQNAQSRAAFALETRAQIRRDFGRAAALQLALPSVSTSLSSNLPAPLDFSSAAPPLASGAQFFETARQSDASKAPLTATSTRKRAQIAASLRRRARLDATQWARLYAAHRGALWSGDAATETAKQNAPDATAAALGTIFPGTAR